MNYSDIAKDIAQTMRSGGEPLSEAQRDMLVGCIAVYCERAYEEGMSHQSKLEIQGRRRFLDELRSKREYLATGQPYDGYGRPGDW